MRVCNVCKESKDLAEFHKCRSFPLGHVYTCKICAREKTKLWASANPDKKKKQGQKHYLENKAEYLSRSKNSNWAKENRDKVNETNRERYRKNPEVYFKTVVMRRSYLKMATPSWLSESQIDYMKRIYSLSKKVSTRTGKKHHVDHIVPIRGKDVCGLHVPWNLQVLPAEMNISKNNTYRSDWD